MKDVSLSVFSVPGGDMGGVPDLSGPCAGQRGVPSLGGGLSERDYVHGGPGQELQQQPRASGHGGTGTGTLLSRCCGRHIYFFILLLDNECFYKKTVAVSKSKLFLI